MHAQCHGSITSSLTMMTLGGRVQVPACVMTLTMQGDGWGASLYDEGGNSEGRQVHTSKCDDNKMMHRASAIVAQCH